MPKLVCFSACLVWYQQNLFSSGHFSLWLGLKTCRSTRVHNNHLKVGLQLIFPQHQFTINPFQNLCLVTWWAYFWKALFLQFLEKFFLSLSILMQRVHCYQNKYSHNLVKQYHLAFMYLGHSVNWKKKKSLNIVLFSNKNVNIMFLQFLTGIYFTPYSCRRRYNSRHQSWCVWSPYFRQKVASWW